MQAARNHVRLWPCFSRARRKRCHAAWPSVHAHGNKVVPQGGMTGLAGGANPHENEIALSLERMVEEWRDRPRLRHVDCPCRHASRRHSVRRGRSRLSVRNRSRCTWHVHDRQERGNQRRRQPGPALWDDAPKRAVPRGTRGRARNSIAQQDAEEQRGLRLDAALHWKQALSVSSPASCWDCTRARRG